MGETGTEPKADTRGPHLLFASKQLFSSDISSVQNLCYACRSQPWAAPGLLLPSPALPLPSMDRDFHFLSYQQETEPAASDPSPNQSHADGLASPCALFTRTCRSATLHCEGCQDRREAGRRVNPMGNSRGIPTCRDQGSFDLVMKQLRYLRGPDSHSGPRP